MNHDKFESLLRKRFERKVRDIQGNNLYLRDGRIDLKDLYEECCDREDFKEILKDYNDDDLKLLTKNNQNKYFLEEYFSSIDDSREGFLQKFYRCEPLFDMKWEHNYFFSDSISMFKANDGSTYIYHLYESEPEFFDVDIFLCLGNEGNETLLRDAIYGIISRMEWQYSIFDYSYRFPDTIINYMPKEITASLLRQSISARLEAHGEDAPRYWYKFYSNVCLHVRRPESTKNLDRIKRPDNIVSPLVKSLLLDIYFSECYQEVKK